MKNQKSFIFSILIGIVAVLIIGCCVHVFSQNKTFVTPAAPVGTVTTAISATPSVSSTSTQTAISGMEEYTDSNFGFSFWYPNNWTIAQSPVQNPNKYPGGIITKQLDITSGSRLITVEEFSSPAFSITDSTGVGACPVCSTTNYYFDTDNHTWMVVYPNGASSGKPAAAVPAPADVSNNTMGGLHMLAGSQRFGANVIIPLSAQNFVVVTVDGAIATGDSDAQALAKTIVASNPAVATPISASQQVQIIQEEENAYSSIEGISPAVVSASTIEDPANFNTQGAAINDENIFVSQEGSSTIDANGCYRQYPARENDMKMTISGVQFCVSSYGSPGAGTVLTDYYYTTHENGSYLTMDYLVHTLTCGALEGEPGYLACNTSLANDTNNILNAIQTNAGAIAASVNPFATSTPLTYSNPTYGFNISYQPGVIPLVSSTSTSPIVSIPLQNPPQAVDYSELDRIDVGVSTSSDALSGCLTVPSDDMVAYANDGTVSINGTNFLHYSHYEPAAGQFYSVDSYRTVRGNECWSVDLYAFGEESNRSAQSAVTNLQVQNQLDADLQTFKFTN